MTAPFGQRLAINAGYEHSYVSRLEHGLRAPSRETVLALAAALAATPEETDDLLVSAGYLPSVAGIVRLAARYLAEVG